MWTKKINAFFILFALPLILLGQLNTNSVYSRFGIGDIERNGFGYNRAMGNLAFALRDKHQINYLNPASYTAQDTNSFIIDFGFIGKRTNHQTNTSDYQSNIMNIDHIAIGFPVTKFWKTSIGITPFSKIGYQINENDAEPGFEINREYRGSGGISRFYVGNSFEPLKGLSIGFNASYLFGYLEHDKTINFRDFYFSNTHTIKETTVGDFLFNAGLQFEHKINDNLKLAFGAIYNNKTKINTRETMMTINSLYINNTFIEDTLNSYKDQKSTITLPANYGAGITAMLYDKFLVGIDYYHQDWESVSSSYASVYKNNHSFNVGLEFTPDKDAFRWYWKKIHYRLGAYYRDDYLNFNDPKFSEKDFYGQSIDDFGITFGLGLPFKNTNTTFNIAYEYKIMGKKAYGLVQENSNIVSISFTFYDVWFVQSKYE